MGETVTNEQFEKLLREVEYLQDEYARTKKMYEDLFYNLDYDNFGTAVKKDMARFIQTFREVYPGGLTAESSIAQTAKEIRFEVSEAFDGVTEKIAEVSITAEKIKWLVADGGDESSFTLTGKFAEIVSENIDLTGYVTFKSMEDEEEATVINGPNINGGVITGTVIRGGTLESVGGSGRGLVKIQNNAMMFYNGNTLYGSLNFNNDVLQLGSTGVMNITGDYVILNYVSGALLRKENGFSQYIASTADIANAIAAHVATYH